MEAGTIVFDRPLVPAVYDAQDVPSYLLAGRFFKACPWKRRRGYGPIIIANLISSLRLGFLRSSTVVTSCQPLALDDYNLWNLSKGRSHLGARYKPWRHRTRHVATVIGQPLPSDSIGKVERAPFHAFGYGIE